MSILLNKLRQQQAVLRDSLSRVSRAIQSEQLRIALEKMATDTELMKALKIQQEDK